MMKKYICVIMIAVFAFSVIACSKEQPSENIVEFEPEPEPSETVPFPEEHTERITVIDIDAPWEGYTELPFDEFLKKGIPAVYEETSEVKSCAVISHEGWNCEGFLDEKDVSEDSKPITYVVDTVMSLDGEDKTVGFKFYMELTTENILKAVGSETYTEGDGWGDVFNAEETENLIEELKAFM